MLRKSKSRILREITECILTDSNEDCDFEIQIILRKLERAGYVKTMRDEKGMYFVPTRKARYKKWEAEEL